MILLLRILIFTLGSQNVFADQTNQTITNSNMNVVDRMTIYKTSDCNGEPLTKHETTWALDVCNFDSSGSLGRVISCINDTSILHQEFSDSSCTLPTDPIELYIGPICAPFDYNDSTLYVEHEFACNMEQVDICASPLLARQEACDVLRESCEFKDGSCVDITEEPTLGPTVKPSEAACIDDPSELNSYGLNVSCSKWLKVAHSQDPYEPWCEFMFLDQFRFGDSCCKSCLDYVPKPIPMRYFTTTPAPTQYRSTPRPYFTTSSNVPQSSIPPIKASTSAPTFTPTLAPSSPMRQTNCFSLPQPLCYGPSIIYGQVCVYDVDDFLCRSIDYNELDEYFICEDIEMPSLCVGSVGYGYVCSWNLWENECQSQFVGGPTSYGFQPFEMMPCKSIYNIGLCIGQCWWNVNECKSLMLGGPNVRSKERKEGHTAHVADGSEGSSNWPLLKDDFIRKHFKILIQILQPDKFHGQLGAGKGETVVKQQSAFDAFLSFASHQPSIKLSSARPSDEDKQRKKPEVQEVVTNRFGISTIALFVCICFFSAVISHQLFSRVLRPKISEEHLLPECI